MHPLEKCGFVRDAEKWFKMVRPGYAFHVYVVQGGWSAGVARSSNDFELTDYIYQTDRLSEDVIWGKRTYADPVAAALAAVQYAISFGFIAEHQDEIVELRKSLKSINMDDYVEEVSDADKRRERIRSILE